MTVMTGLQVIGKGHYFSRLQENIDNVFIFVFGAVASHGAVVASQYIGRKDKENGIAAASCC